MDVLKVHITPAHLWSASIIWPIVCVGVVGARFAVRRANSRIGWDDWLTIPSLIGMLGLSAAVLYSLSTKATGYPDEVWESFKGQYRDFHSPKFTVNRKIFMVFHILQTMTLAFIKLSCLVLYRRIFKTGLKKIPETILRILMVIIVLWGIGFSLAMIIACSNNVSYLWGDVTKCRYDARMASTAVAISDVITDLFLLLFPLPYIYKLQVSHTRKIGLLFIFLLGSASIAMSVTRLECLLQFLNESRALTSGKSHTSPSRLLTIINYFMLLETGFALFAICLPVVVGGFKLPGVQLFFSNLSNVFAHRSGSSISPSDAEKGIAHDADADADASSMSRKSASTEHAAIYRTDEVMVTSERV